MFRVSLIFILLVLITATAKASCLDETQQYVDRGEFAKAYEIFRNCYDTKNHEHIFALAMLHINSVENKAELDKKVNIEIAALLKTSLIAGHVKSRALLIEMYGSGEYEGIKTNKKVLNCLKNDSNLDNLFRYCFKERRSN